MSARRSFWSTALLLGAALALGGCATKPARYDYSAYLASKPATLLVMPPINDSPDIKATPAVWAHATLPLAEAGYYVLPVTLVDEMLRQNGVDTAADAQQIPLEKLREQFNADAAVYLRVKQYGTTYALITSTTTVAVEARVVDLRNGQLLWQGTAAASSAEQQQASGGLAGMLISALVNQIVGTVSDAAFNYAGIADQRLLTDRRVNGVLPGPRSQRAWQVATPN